MDLQENTIKAVVKSIFSNNAKEVSDKDFNNFVNLHNTEDQTVLNHVYNSMYDIMCDIEYTDKTINVPIFKRFIDTSGRKFVDNILKSGRMKPMGILVSLLSNSDIREDIYVLIYTTTIKIEPKTAYYFFDDIIDNIMFEKDLKTKRRITTMLVNIANHHELLYVYVKCIDDIYKDIKTVPELLNVDEKMFEEIFQDTGMEDFDKMKREGVDLYIYTKDKEYIYEKQYKTSENKVWTTPYPPYSAKFYEYIVFYIFPLNGIVHYMLKDSLNNVKKLLHNYPPDFTEEQLYYMFIKHKKKPSEFITDMKIITNVDYTYKLIKKIATVINNNDINTLENVDALFCVEGSRDIMRKACPTVFDYRKIKKMVV